MPVSNSDQLKLIREERRKRRRGRRQIIRRKNRALKKARKSEQEYKPVHLRRCSPADCVGRDMTIHCKGQRFFESSEKPRVGPLARLPTSYKGFQKIGIYSSNMLCAVRTRFIGRATNKSAKFFGIDPKKDRRWAALLRAIACSGLNAADFRSVMRIRDLKIRGKWTAYCKGITGFIHRLPRAHVNRALYVDLRC